MLERRTFLSRAAGMAAALVLASRTRRVAATTGPDLGTRLYELVRIYAKRTHHRTGSRKEWRTTNWFAGELARRGATTSLVPYDFDRFIGRTHVAIGGRRVQSLPLFYSWIGAVDTTAPATGSLVVANNSSAADLPVLIANAQSAGAPALVLATTSNLDAEGRIIAVNLDPVLGSGLPVVLVGGAQATTLAGAAIRVRARARLVPGRSSNVYAVFGTPAADPVVVATPLSGWWRCAGERGTGIAVALELAARLAQSYPTIVIGTTGHELNYLGLMRFLAQQPLTPRLIVHLGASVAAGTADGVGGLTLSSMRFAAENFDAATGAAVAAALAPASFIDLHDPVAFLGEGTIWQTVGAPLLSFSGTFPLFHTDGDTAKQTVAAAPLATVYAAIEQATLTALAALP
jgi:hypothetical protein